MSLLFSLFTALDVEIYLYFEHHLFIFHLGKHQPSFVLQATHCLVSTSVWTQLNRSLFTLDLNVVRQMC